MAEGRGGALHCRLNSAALEPENLWAWPDVDEYLLLAEACSIDSLGSRVSSD